MRANTAKGSLALLACVGAVALVSSWASPRPTTAASGPTPAGVVASATASPAPDRQALTGPAITALAVRVAGTYRAEGFDEKFRLYPGKLALDEETNSFIYSCLDSPTLVKNTDALRRLLEEPAATIPQWPEEAVRLTFPGTAPEHVLSLSDPLPDPKVPDRYYFFCGEGAKYYSLGMLTVDVRPGEEEPKLFYEFLIEVHPPMNLDKLRKKH